MTVHQQIQGSAPQAAQDWQANAGGLPVMPPRRLTFQDHLEAIVSHMERLSRAGYAEGDEVVACENAIDRIIADGRADNISAETAFRALSAWFTAEFERMAENWHEVGKYEAAESNSRGPRCFRGM